MASAIASRDMVRRSRLEMMCDILTVVSSGSVRPTHIAYRANLSWSVLSRYLGRMVEKGLLVKTSRGQRTSFAITPKGEDVLALFEAVRQGLETGYPEPAAMLSAQEALRDVAFSAPKASNTRRVSVPAR